MTAVRPVGKRRERDMTIGSIVGNLIRFSLPLMAGNLFQQLYNLVDTWVIGQTRQTDAYAAVGSVGPIINILIGFFSGFATGVGVVISQYYGAKRYDRVSDAAHTAMLTTVLLGVGFTLLGMFGTPWLLRLMLPSAETAGVLAHGKTYLTIYFSGMMGLMLYNIGSGILRAIGDSTRPFYFLVVSAVINTVLDLVFVFVFHMGVAGVAWATVIAQWLSAVLTVVTLLRCRSCVRLEWRRLHIHRDLLGAIIRIGVPSALQLALTAFSNVFVQSYVAGVNTDKTFCLAGWTSYSKIDHIIFVPIQALAMAVTTFVGQNYGVNNMRRARRGALVGYGICTVCVLCIIVPVVVFAPQLAPLFNDDPRVVHYAVLLLRCITPFFLLSCANQVFSAALRGAGNSRAPMVIMLSTFVGFRQVYLFVMSRFIANEILPIGMSYPAGWLTCCIVMVWYYRRYRFEVATFSPKAEEVTP